MPRIDQRQLAADRYQCGGFAALVAFAASAAAAAGNGCRSIDHRQPMAGWRDMKLLMIHDNCACKRIHLIRLHL